MIKTAFAILLFYSMTGMVLSLFITDDSSCFSFIIVSLFALIVRTLLSAEEIKPFINKKTKKHGNS